MVDYRGPKLFQSSFEKFEIPTFARVIELNYLTDVQNVILDSDTIDSMEHLETISISGKPTPQQVEKITKALPPCRVSKVENISGKLKIRTNHGADVFCCEK